ncbi:YdcF family protein [Mammaliicoccus sp. Dog046]|uniref:YdcF family protein n=1 Tax=Mammaliicoccus sp. Dog046 TaxID=3034233 RepID=UPI002B25C36F|nr:YdcF family protein [Mammaliicoccus sp. Dog046]WQK84641.1 YdcF family protein [Mammaliicoccus sp. Dog046]
MLITVSLLILFIISYVIEFREYKNIFILGAWIIALLSSIFFGMVVPQLQLNMNINYLLMGNIVYSLIIIVIMLLSLLNTKKKIANEGKVVTNTIVLGYGIFILFNFLVIIFKPYIFVDCLNGLILILLSFTFYYFNLIFILHNLYTWIINRVSKKHNSEFIIVLGAGLIEGKVTPLLQARLDKAIKIKQSNPEALIIVSGGQGPDEMISEAEAMKNYLLEQGINIEDIILENQSTNTSENLMYSMKIMKKFKKNPIVTIVTSHFHVLRAACLSKELKINANIFGGSSKYYFYPNAYIRECFALMYMYLKTHIIVIIILLAIIITYTLMK